MTGTYKYIKWILGIMLWMNISCSDKENVRGPEDGDGLESEIELMFTYPRTYATTEGSLTERNIKTVDLLVFKNDQLQYHRPAFQRVASFHSTLLVDDNITIYFLVNAHEQVAGCTELVAGKNWENDIRPSLLLDAPESLIASDSLPMWAVKKDITIEKDIINYINDIFLLRSVASVDVYNNTPAGEFELHNAYIYFAPDQGYLAPSIANYNQSGQTVTAPESPSGMANVTQKLGVDASNPDQILYQLYLYENDVTLTGNTSQRNSRIVIGGSYKGGGTTYYPVDFLNDDLDDYCPVMRNYKYIISITDVLSEGFPDPGTASEAFDTRLKVKVIDWNQKDENEIVFYGPDYISVESKIVYVHRPAGSFYTLNMSTSLDKENLWLEFADSGNGTAVDEGKWIMYNDRFRVEIVFDESGEKVKELLVTALGDYDPDNASHNTQVFYVQSKHIRMEITIHQLNEVPTDWIDGGEVDVTVGEDDE